MATVRAPSGLATRGRRLWRDVVKIGDLGPADLVMLEEACRITDRLDKIDLLLSGELETWVDLRDMKGHPDAVEVVMDSALSEARQQANTLKQLLVALRLPDEAGGAKPQRRGARGAYKTGSAKSASRPGVVSSLDRARAARSG